MTQHQWESIERSLGGLSLSDKLELIERIAHSLRAEESPAPDRTRRQRDNLDRLRAELAAMPVSGLADGLSNRHHD